MGAAKGNQNAKGNSGGGRLTDYDEKFCQIAYCMALLGATDEDLAQAFDVSRTTINEWKNKYVEFSEHLKRGKLVADSNVAARLYERALGYEHDSEEIKVVSVGNNGGSEIERVPIRKIYPPDTVAAIFWLKNRQPSKWRDKQEVEHSGEIKTITGMVVK